jgi:hypothetical protein
VTNDRDDFLDLLGKVELHAGLIVIVPQCRREAQKALFRAALEHLQKIGSLTNQVLEVNEDRRIAVYDLPTTTAAAGQASNRTGRCE